MKFLKNLLGSMKPQEPRDIEAGADYPEAFARERIISVGWGKRGEDIRLCFAKNTFLGNINGYVRLPDGHPWERIHGEDMPTDVHGGITYSDGRWIGFDTCHYGDYWETFKTTLGTPLWPTQIQWDQEMVRNETEWLADEVLAANRSSRRG